MSDERWKQIKQIAHAALPLYAAERARFLDEACPDAEIRKEVESLLSHESDSFLEKPVAGRGATPGALAIGARLGQFEILEPLGAGGMGEVFRAHDSKLGGDVAIKVLPPGFAQDRDRLARFEREAKAVAALDHPNVVTLHSVEEHEGVHFITMQLVQGRTLSELLPEKGLPLDRFFTLAVPLTDAICAAHRHGITHRDLKPGNVMVGADERVRVLDFGLAKLLEDGTAQGASELPTQHLTEEGRVLGTVAYMSPEQAEGKAIDHRSDIFSLGILLYEMATGQRPFQGETRVSTITAILRDEPAPITALRSDAPRHLARIIKRSLAKDPGRRYQTAIDLRNELEELRREVGPSITSSARHRTGGSARSQPDAKPTPAQPRPSATRSRDRDVSTDSEILGDLIRRRRAPLIVAAGVLIALLVAVYRMLPSPADPVAQLGNTQLTTLEGVELGASWSPDAGRIAVSTTLTGSADIRMRPTAGGTPVLLAVSERDEHTPRWAPSRELIAYMMNTPQGQTIRLVGSTGGPSRPLANTNVQVYDGVDIRGLVGASPWSLDGGSFLFSRFDRQSRTLAIYQIDVDSLEQQQFIDPEPGAQDRAAAWSPDGSHVVFERTGADGSHGLWLVDADGGGLGLLLEDEPMPQGPDWLDDDTVVFSWARSGNPDLWRLDLDHPRNPTQLTTGAGDEIDPVVASDGRIAYSDYSHQSNLIWLSIGAAGAEPEPLTAEGKGSNSFGARGRRDGERVVYYSDRHDPGNNNLWLTARGSPARPSQLTTSTAQEIQPDWSPDGNEIVFLSNQDGRYQLYVLNTETTTRRKLAEQEVLVWPVGATYSQGPRWSPDGDVIGYLVRTDDGTPALRTISPDGTDLPMALSGVLSFGWYRDGEHVIYAHKSPEESGAIELWAANLADGTQALLLAAEVGEIAVGPDGSAVSYLSARSHYTQQLQVQNLEPDPTTGLPRLVGEPRSVPARPGAGHIHNGGWTWDGSAVVYTRDIDQGDIWAFGERR